MGNCCTTPVKDKRSPVYLVDVSTGDLSTVSTFKSNTQFFFGSDLDPLQWSGTALKFKQTFRTPNSAAAKAGPLVIFPVDGAPEGSKPWKHPSDTKNVINALYNHLLFHGGEQILYVSWVDAMEDGKKTGTFVLVVTSLGRLFLTKGDKVKDSFHVGDIHTMSLGLPGEVKLVLSPVHSGLRDPKLPTTHNIATSPAAGEALIKVLRAISRVLYANAPLQALQPAVTGSAFQELPVPSPSQDGGFHSAYCMWHNLHAEKIHRQLVASGQGHAPCVELVGGAAGGKWNEKTAIAAVRSGLKKLELDISGWDPTATEAAAWAMRYNNVFKSFRAGAKATQSAVLLAPVLAYNSVLLKFSMTATSSVFAGPEAMAQLGNALARNPKPGLAEITIPGNRLSGDAGIAWAGGLENLKTDSLVVLDVTQCKMEEVGSVAVVGALATQAQSISTIKLSGNRLGAQGSQRLCGLIGQGPASLQILAIEDCQANLETVGASLSEAAARLRSLASLDVSGNPWSSVLVDGIRELKTLKHLRLANTAIQPDALQELMLAAAGRSLALDISFNQAVASPNGLAAMLNSGIGTASLKAAECGLEDAGTTSVLDASANCTLLKALDIGQNLTLPHDMGVFNSFLRTEINDPQFLGAVAGAGSADEAMAIYATASQRAALQASQGRVQEMPGSVARMQTAMALTRALLPQSTGQALEELCIAGSKQKAILSFGPFISMPIHLALHINTTLTKLDISHNGMGDAGARILGTSLRHNRTLTSLRMDGNNVELEGLKAIRGCLHGNKKLVELPFLDEDMQAQLDVLAKQYIQCLQQEVDARLGIGRAYKYYGGGRVHHGMYNDAMSKLKAAKTTQSQSMQAKNKLRTTASQIQGDVLRNQFVAEIKAAKQLAKAEDKASLNSLKSLSKASEKLTKLEENNKKRAWENRYKLMKQWSKTVQGAAGAKANTVWWTTWLQAWGKPYLTRDGLDSLWSAVPAGEKDRYESVHEYSTSVFAQQQELSDQIKGIKLQKQTGEADAQYHKKEAEYYSFVSAKDPNGIRASPPHPGIVQGRKPGDVPGNFRTYGGQVDWQQRRNAMVSDLNQHIAKGPPKDFKWTSAPDPNNPTTAPTGQAVTAEALNVSGAPMLAYGTPVEQVPGVPAESSSGAPSAPAWPATAAAGADVEPPNVVPGTPQATAPPPGYPGAATSQVGAAPYKPPETPQPYQAAAAAPGGAQGYHFYNSYVEDESRFQNRPPEYHNYYYGPGRYGGAYDAYGDSDYYYDRNGRRRRRYSYDSGYGSSILPAALLFGVMYSPFYSPWYGGYWGYGFGGGWGYGGYGGYHHTEVNNYYYGDGAEEGAAADELGDVPPDEVAEGQDADVDNLDADGGDDMAGDEGDVIAGDEAEGMDMYGGAGPRDLPDGSPDHDRVNPNASGKRKVLRSWDESALDEMEVRMWFESRWAQVLARAEEQVLGQARCLSHERQQSAFISAKPSLKFSCTLVTQASLDRRPQILDQALAWGGLISLALFVPAVRGSPEAAELLKDVAALHQQLEGGPATVNISIMWAYDPSGDPNASPRTAAYDKMYPVNALRNLAMSAASTELVLLLDIDFQPSQGLMEAAEGNRPAWDATAQAIASVRKSISTGHPVMAVVPAFEVSPKNASMPKSKRALQALVACGKASGFHTGHFPQGHHPTDFSRWMSARRPYSIEYKEYFEPYVFAARQFVPAYDERFRGYGMNKISHLYTAAAIGFSFHVVPEAFVAAFEHKKSESWEATFGDAAKTEQKVRISTLYRHFKQDLRTVPWLIDPVTESRQQKHSQALRAVAAERPTVMLGAKREQSTCSKDARVGKKQRSSALPLCCPISLIP